MEKAQKLQVQFFVQIPGRSTESGVDLVVLDSSFSSKSPSSLSRGTPLKYPSNSVVPSSSGSGVGCNRLSSRWVALDGGVSLTRQLQSSYNFEVALYPRHPAWQAEKKVVSVGSWQTGVYLIPSQAQFVLHELVRFSLLKKEYKISQIFYTQNKPKTINKNKEERV